jgi:23S rRNA pseudouridine1911/1915/1917 synthase
MLHAWKLAFRHPRSGEELSFEAPVPRDFADAMRQIPGS